MRAPFLKKVGNLEYREWKYIERFMSVVQFMIIIFGVCFTVYQIQEIKNNELGRKYDLYAKFYDKMITAPNRQIMLSIDKNKPLLVSEGGKFSEDQLDDYLGVLHDVNQNLEIDLLNGGMICSGFYDITQGAWKNIYIQNYLLEIRKTDPTYFLGFDRLYTFIETCE